MREYDYKGYKLFSNELISHPRVDLYFDDGRVLSPRGSFTSLDQAMRAVDSELEKVAR